jgi:HEAT repeat protein
VRRTLGDLLRSPEREVRLAVLKAVESSPQASFLPRGPLLALLNDGDSRVRVLAAGIIRQKDLEAKDVIDGLLAALQDPDSDVRAAAAEKLTEAVWRQDSTDEQGRPVLWAAPRFPVAGNPTAGEVLRSALNDSSSRVRGAAAWLLAAFPQEADRSIPLLIERLKDPAGSVRAAAAEALAHFGPKARAAVRPLLAILADPSDRDQEGAVASLNAAKALLALGDNSKSKMVHLVLGQLNALDDAVRAHATRILIGLGPRVTDDLVHALADRRLPRQVHVEILRILHNDLAMGAGRDLVRKPPRPAVLAIVPVVRSLARDADSEVQLMALTVLAAIEPEADDAAEAYLDRLHTSGDEDLAEQWLDLVSRPAMIPRLIQGLRDEDAEVRLGVMHVLLSSAETLAETERADTGDGVKHQLAPALLERLRDPDDRVRWFATEALGVLHVEAKTVVPVLIGMARTERRRVPADEAAIRSFEEAGQPYLLGPNKKAGDPLRIAAIQALGGFGPEAAEAVPELTRALRDEDRRVRWFAAEALGLIGPEAKAATPALVEAIRSPDVATGDAVDDGEALKDGPIRLIAAFALGRIGPGARAAVPELIAALSGPDSRVRGAAARALGLMGPDAREAIPHLIRLAGRGSVSGVAECAQEALTQLGADAMPGLIRAFHDRDPATRLAAFDIISELDDRTALPIAELARCLSDPVAEVRQAAATILASVGDRPGSTAAIPRLVIALGDDDDDVAEAARDALAAIVTHRLTASLPVLNAAVARSIEASEPFRPRMIGLRP